MFLISEIFLSLELREFDRKRMMSSTYNKSSCSALCENWSTPVITGSVPVDHFNLETVTARVFLTCSEVQRRGLPPRCVPAVHVLCCHQFTNSLQVSAATGLEQLPVDVAGPQRTTATRVHKVRHHGPRGHGSTSKTGHSRTSPPGRHGQRRRTTSQFQTEASGEFGV